MYVLGWVGLGQLALVVGWVGLQKLWVGLSWVMKNGPMSMSDCPGAVQNFFIAIDYSVLCNFGHCSAPPVFVDFAYLLTSPT